MDEGGVDEIVGGGVWLALASLTASLAGAVFWLLASVLVGSEGVGYATTAFSAAGFLAVFSGLGLPVAVMREAPIRGFRALATGLLAGGASSLAAALLGARVFSGFFGGAMGRYSVLVGILTLLMVESQVSMASLIALRAEHIYFAVVAAAQVVKLVGGLGLAAWGMGAWGLVAGIGIAITMQLFLALLASLRRMEWRPPRISDVVGVIRVGFSNYPLIISTGLVTSLSVLLAALSSGSPSDTGVFYIALMIAMATGFVPAGIASSALPRMVSGSPVNALSKAARIGLGLVAPLAAALAAAPSSILGVLGARYVGGAGILRLFSLSIIPVAGLSLASSRLNAEARLIRLLAAGLARLGSLLLLVALLAGPWSLVGVAAAYTASSLTGFLVAAWPALMATALHAAAVYGVGVLAGAASLYMGIHGAPLLLISLASGYAAAHLSGLLRIREAASLIPAALSRLSLPRPRGIHLGLEDVGRGFVLAFIILLVLAALFLAMGNEPEANLLAEYAYYMLVLGVAALLVDTARSRDED